MYEELILKAPVHGPSRPMDLLVVIMGPASARWAEGELGSVPTGPYVTIVTHSQLEPSRTSEILLIVFTRVLQIGNEQAGHPDSKNTYASVTLASAGLPGELLHYLFVLVNRYLNSLTRGYRQHTIHECGQLGCEHANGSGGPLRSK